MAIKYTDEFLPSIMIPDQNSPDPDCVSYYVLEKERMFYLDFDIDESLTALHRMILRWNLEDTGKPVEERKPIKLFVMSYGGSIDYCYSLIDWIKASNTPVWTIDIGVAASAGGLIFISGHKRFMTKTARVLIHEGSAEMAGDAQKIMDATDSYKKALKKMKEFIAENTGITMKELMKKRSNDWELDATYCLEHNVCDAVIDSIEDII